MHSVSSVPSWEAGPKKKSPAQDKWWLQLPGVHPPASHPTLAVMPLSQSAKQAPVSVSIAALPPATIRMIYFGYNTQALQPNRQAPCVPDTGQNKKR